MNGNPSAAKFLKEIGLAHHRDFSTRSQRDALIYEKPQGQGQPGLVFSQIQTAQDIIMDCDQHRANLTALMLTSKNGTCGEQGSDFTFLGDSRRRRSALRFRSFQLRIGH
jgi:hypothetical protein